jgi:hypothetical protein
MNTHEYDRTGSKNFFVKIFLSIKKRKRGRETGKSGEKLFKPLAVNLV